MKNAIEKIKAAVTKPKTDAISVPDITRPGTTRTESSSKAAQALDSINAATEAARRIDATRPLTNRNTTLLDITASAQTTRRIEELHTILNADWSPDGTSAIIRTVPPLKYPMSIIHN